MHVITAFVLTALPLAVVSDGEGHRLRSGETWGARRIVDAGGAASIVLIDQPVSHAVIHDLRVDDVYRVIENAKGATATDLVIRDVHATNVTRGLARFRGASSGLIENSSVVFGPVPQQPPNLPEGLHFAEQAHDWTVRHVTIRGARMSMGPDRYWNGDGIATERGTHGFRFTDVTADGNSDAGFDLKGEDTYLERVSASGNARNYRFWTSVRAGTLTVGDTVLRGGKGATAGIEIIGDLARPPVVTIDRLIVRMRTPTSIFAVKNAAVIRVGRCEFDVPRGTRLVTSQAGVPDFKGGPGCTLPD